MARNQLSVTQSLNALLCHSALPHHASFIKNGVRQSLTCTSTLEKKCLDYNITSNPMCRDNKRRVALTKQMNFLTGSNQSKKKYVADFEPFNSAFTEKNCSMIFQIRGRSQRPFGTFPKIHPLCQPAPPVPKKKRARSSKDE